MNTGFSHHARQVNTTSYAVCCKVEGIELHKHLYVETQWNVSIGEVLSLSHPVFNPGVAADPSPDPSP